MSEAERKEDALREELKEYRQEKEKIKQIIGSIGGTDFLKKHKIINYIFLAIVLILFALEITTDFLPTYISLEVAVLLISIKIVWLIHSMSKMDHFQFWILNSIEFRINSLSRKVDTLEERLKPPAMKK